VPELDLGFLALVLIDEPSLAIDFQAWARMGKNIDCQGLPHPWSTKTLTSSGIAIAPLHITMRPSGEVFLASVAHLIVLPHIQINQRFVGLRVLPQADNK
jgi:hypothetical protein